jgi:hypothetical protein
MGPVDGSGAHLKNSQSKARQADKPTRFPIGVNSTMLCDADSRCAVVVAWRTVGKSQKFLGLASQPGGSLSASL